MRVVHVRDNVESWDRAAEQIKSAKPSTVAIQAPERFQPLVDSLVSNLISWEDFLDKVSVMTGIPSPELDEKTGWVRAVRACDLMAARTVLLEPDIDTILKEVGSRLNIKNKDRVLMEARQWYLNRTGFPLKLMRYLFVIFALFPHFIRIVLVKAVFGAYAFISNIIPGDQHDVIAAMAFADSTISERMAAKLKEVEPDMVVLHEWYADDVLERYSELA